MRHRGRLLRAAMAGAATLLLAGCFNPVKPEVAADTGNSALAQHNWEARRSALQQVQNFSLQGRLAESGLVSFGGALSWIRPGRVSRRAFTAPSASAPWRSVAAPATWKSRTKAAPTRRSSRKP